jgi:cytochrome c oxidase assembly factor CtaG/putative copper export protein
VTEQLTSRPGAVQPRRRWPVLVGATAAAAVATAMALVAAAGTPPHSGSGLGVPTTAPWLVPGLRVLTDLLAVVTVGCLLGAAVLLPGDRLLSVAGYRWVQTAGRWAGVWSLVSLATIPALLVEFLGQGWSALSLSATAQFLTDSPQAQAQVAVAVLTALLAGAARAVLTMRGAMGLLMVGLVATLPPVVAACPANAGGPAASTAVALHVLGVVLWAGGLVALLLARKVSVSATSVAVARFSRLAGVLVLVVGGSGIVTALTALSAPAQVIRSSYGVLLLIKLVAFVGLATVGAWHRRSTLPALAAGRPSAFLRLATVEVVLFGATVGVAVALSRTPTPTASGPVQRDGAHAVLGFPLPEPPSPGVLLDVYPGLFFPVLVAAGLAFYLAGVRRMSAAGRPWPRLRTFAWCTALALVILVTTSGLARYGGVLSSVHVLQHLTLSLAVPLLLVLARPGALAMRALRPATGTDALGPREWLAAVRGHPAVRAALHPLVALQAYLVVNYSVYVTGLYDVLLRSQLADMVFFSLFLISGVLFFRALLGPAERGAAEHPGLSVVVPALAGWAVAHGVIALVVLRSGPLLAAEWWSRLQRIWGPMPIEDQQTAGRIAATYGVAMLFATALAILWPRTGMTGSSPTPAPSATAEEEATQAELTR